MWGAAGVPRAKRGTPCSCYIFGLVEPFIDNLNPAAINVSINNDMTAGARNDGLYSYTKRPITKPKIATVIARCCWTVTIELHPWHSTFFLTETNLDMPELHCGHL